MPCASYQWSSALRIVPLDSSISAIALQLPPTSVTVHFDQPRQLPDAPCFRDRLSFLRQADDPEAHRAALLPTLVDQNMSPFQYISSSSAGPGRARRGG